MTTNLHFFINETKSRWLEVDLLIQEAKKYEDQNNDLYHVLCRSASVFILAHLEGFYKGLVRCLIDDINENLCFKQIPSCLKHSYADLFCEDVRNREKLINVLDNHEVKLTIDAFLPDKNKNISVDVIDGIFKKLGCKYPTFYILDVPKIQECFELGEKSLREKILMFFKIVDRDLKVFPYQIDLLKEELINQKLDKQKNPRKSFWNTFIDTVNIQRHHIAHGEVFDNLLSIQEIEKSRLKAEIMQFILTLYAAHHISYLVKG